MTKMEHYLHFPLALILVISLFSKLNRAETQSFSTSSSSSSSSSNGGPAQHTFEGSSSWNNNGKKGGDKFGLAWEGGKGKLPPGVKVPNSIQGPGDFKPPKMPKFEFPKFPSFGNPFEQNNNNKKPANKKKSPAKPKPKPKPKPKKA